MKDPFEFLLRDNTNLARVAPERLELMGKQAASMYLTEGISLNDAIVKLAADDGDLENEHIRRIVEFANNAVFKKKFDVLEDKNVHFPLADPAAIIRDLKDGGSPAHMGSPVDDYDYPPDSNSEETVKSAVETMGPGNMVKEASVPYQELRHANPLDDVYDLYLRLESARDTMQARYSGIASITKEASSEFYHEVKKEVITIDGVGFDGIAAALIKVASYEEVTSALSAVAARLMGEGQASKEKLAQANNQIGQIINPEHPIVSSFEHFLKTAAECLSYKIGAEAISEQMIDITTFIKQKSHEV